MSSPTWIKAEIFEHVLKEIEPDYKCVSKFNCYPALKPGENYGTTLYRVDIEINLLSELQMRLYNFNNETFDVFVDNESKEIFFMMKTKLESSTLDDITASFNIFTIEREMYLKLVPELEELYKYEGTDVKFMARCYDLNVNETHILLENMIPKGFKNADRLVGLDLDHIKCALKKLAQWHAASAVRVERKGVYTEPYLLGVTSEWVIPFINGMKHSFFEFLKLNNYEELLQKAQNYCQNINERLKAENTYDEDDFNVLCHGDYWTNNILFQYDGQGNLLNCVLIDYQVPKYGSPAIDLLQIIIGSTNADIKVSQFDYLIKYYHDILKKNLELLNYSKPIPKLRDIHTIILKNTFCGNLNSFTYIYLLVLYNILFKSFH